MFVLQTGETIFEIARNDMSLFYAFVIIYQYVYYLWQH